MSLSLVVSASSTTATSSSSSSSTGSGSRRLAVLPRSLRPRGAGAGGGGGAGSSTRSDDARVLRFGLASGAGAGRAEISSSSSSSTGGGNALAAFGGRPGRLVADAAGFVSTCCGEAVEDRVVVGGDAGITPRFRPVLCLPFFAAVAVFVSSGVGAAGLGAAVVLARLEPRVNVKSPSCSSYTAVAKTRSYVNIVSSQTLSDNASHLPAMRLLLRRLAWLLMLKS